MNIKKICSFKIHKEIEAITYCHICKIYMCNICSNYHDSLFENHQYSLNKNINEIFLDICKEENHQNKLEYFCKNHNILCCAFCITKIEGHGNGQHKNCEVCFIEDIKEEKKNRLKENIIILEKLSNNFEETINELKTLFEKINKDKETLKKEVKKIFSIIRNTLNEREDELLFIIDNKFNDICFNENIIKEIDKFPHNIKLSLEKGKLIDKEWNENNNELNLLINNCINIENNIKEINLINDDIKKCKSNNIKQIKFYPGEKDIDYWVNSIKRLGQISYFDSLILKKLDDYNKFEKLILTNQKINNIRLIYRSTIDGFNYLSIVNKVNNKSNLIFLYLTENKRIFGSLITKKLDNININGTRKYYKDENAFVFSLNNNKIYKILVPQNAIGFVSTRK